MHTLTRTHKLLLIIPALCVAYSVYFATWQMTPLDIQWVVAQDYNEHGEHQKMVDEYRTLVEKYPNEPGLLYPLAWGLYKTGKYGEAAKIVEKYVDRNPYYPAWRQTYINKIRQKAYEEINSPSSSLQRTSRRPRVTPPPQAEVPHSAGPWESGDLGT